MSASRQVDLQARKRVKAASDALEKARLDLERAKDVRHQQLDDVAEKYSKAPSAFLVAVVGGAFGATSGAALAGPLGATLALTGPLGMAVGAALAVLAFRGRNHWRLENATQKLGGAIGILRAQLDTLPRDTPQVIRQQLFDDYAKLMLEYAQIAKESLRD